MKTVTKLSVTSEPQTMNLNDGYTAELRFDPFYYRWFYDLYKDEELLYSGIALTPDSCGLLNISNIAIGMVDTDDPVGEYEPYNAIGTRLMVIEVDDETER